ncbi:MAG TPA: hypothetical protein VI320_12830 [Terracidiphilus sp.]|jgi:hypothetical protein
MGIFLFIVLSVALTGAGIYAYRSMRRLVDADWDTLVARIQPVPFESLETVALDNLQPGPRQLQLDPDEIWKLVGGLDGLKRMNHNADLMIQLAAYVRVWNFDEAVIVAERIRQDAIILKRALHRIKLQGVFRAYRLRMPFYAHQGASAYYLMTRRLLALYETNQYILYPRLAAVL